ncbi:uncharacterized protein LOC129570729 [Sitodiplosis mosellana]|uniref:uncharacterized protein LOC129570729 n=1 Tax=Sitodiplosis mosellana TaxID=263140 RepID=UPI002444C2D3|nr:uncharacterized protein LOC129570729 [Sitodiplosis mosellana]
MTRLILFSILALTLMSTIANADDTAEIEVLNQIDVTVKDEAKEAIGTEETWLNKCTFLSAATKPKTSFLKKGSRALKKYASRVKKSQTPQSQDEQINTLFTNIAGRANRIVANFVAQYDQTQKSTNFTDIQFEKVKSSFGSLARKLRNLDEQLQTDNPMDPRVTKVKQFCTNLFQNMLIMRSVDLKKTTWNKLKRMKKPGVLIGNLGQKLTAKTQKTNAQPQPKTK